MPRVETACPVCNYSNIAIAFKDYHNIEIDLYSHGECFTVGALSTNAGIKIGRYCSFARGVRSHAGNHTMNTKSTHAFFFNPSLGYVNNNLIEYTKLKIGNDVWIGRNAIILKGCDSIGDGCIIGAGAVVNRNFPPYCIVAGNPARLVMKRFPNDKIEELIESKWWEKSIDELKNEIDTFTVPLIGDSIK